MPPNRLPGRGPEGRRLHLMTSPPESRAPFPPPAPARPAVARPPERGDDRLLRTLVSLVGDLTVEREEGGLLRSTLEHVVVSLELAGAAVFSPGEDGDLPGMGDEEPLPRLCRGSARLLARWGGSGPGTFDVGRMLSRVITGLRERECPPPHPPIEAGLGRPNLGPLAPAVHPFPPTDHPHPVVPAPRNR